MPPPMSESNVIIRLQNLPWSAQAVDIRNFFKDCEIPSGGVHIIGGEDGLAFIAFSTDEDARRAMMLNGGAIKGIMVSLYLSSRTEMQKTIEKARNPPAVYMAKTTMPQSMGNLPVAPLIVKKVPEVPLLPQHPPVSNYLTQLMQQQQAPAVIQQPQMNMMPAFQTMMPIVKNPAVNLGLPPASAAVAYANYYTMMDPSAVKYMNQASTAANKPAVTQYNKDPRSRRSPSRERRQRSRSPDRRRRSRSPDSDRDRESGSRRRTRFSERTDNASSKTTTASYSVPPPVGNNIWDAPPPQIFNTANNNSNPPARNYQTENSSNGSSPFGNIGTCVKVSNVDNETFYSDLRKFFMGLPIGNNDIKFCQDAKGNRTGVVLIRFLSSDSKKKALTKSMWQLKSTQVLITSALEEDFENGMVKSSIARKNEERNERERERSHERYRSRSDSRERDVRSYNRYDGNRTGGGVKNDRNFKNFKQENRYEKPKEYEPDENFTVLMVDDIPRASCEADLCEAFPNIKSIIIDRFAAYVKFTSHDAAKVILENRFIHNIANKRVFLYPASEKQFNDLTRELGGVFHNPEYMEVNHIDDDTNHSNHSNSNDSRNRDQKPTIESRDPRQRNFNEQRNFNDPRNFNGNQPENMIQTDCVIMKNMELNTTIEDVEIFYKDVGIYKMRVHILLDKRGNPSGDCFVEFKYPNDSHRAVTKNNQMLKNNRVQVMLIPREQVDAVLSSFGGGRNDNGRPQNRRQDWAPPGDFGSAGCVIMLSNLCYRATTNEILDEFREFNLNPDQIIRKFNDMGQPTGNACINFNSPQDADKALDKYNSIKILNRPVWLKRI